MLSFSTERLVILVSQELSRVFAGMTWGSCCGAERLCTEIFRDGLKVFP